mgnify:CR=1 FL=1
MADWLYGLRVKARALSVRGTIFLLLIVSFAVVAMAGLGYRELRDETRSNIDVRIDRAARAGALTILKAARGVFTVRRDGQGRPLAYQVAHGTAADVLRPSAFLDGLVQEIAAANQGLAEIYRFDRASGHFQRFSATIPGGDAAWVRHAVLGSGHPAYASLIGGVPFVGEVPVDDRKRVASLTPILDENSNVAGLLSVDVGWRDELWRASNDLFARMALWTAGLLITVALAGAWLMYRAMRPLRMIARYARDVVESDDPGPPPFVDREDEVGLVARGMAAVVHMRAQLETLAFTDELTGLPCRAWLEQELSQRLTKTEGLENPSCLLLLGIDNFRLINDAFGHRAGDEVLQYVSGILTSSLQSGARLARFGADEFAVLLGEGRTKKAALRQASALLAALHHPILLRFGSIHLSASIGLVKVPDDGRTVEDALKNVTLAMHKAKATGKNQILAYSDELDYAVQRRIELERDLRSAIVAGDLAIHFQPQVRCSDHSLHGVEALVRWPHRTKGMISPAEFIPIAEESGIIVELGTWVLDEACRQARAWLDSGFDFSKVSVNISPIQLWQPNFERLVAGLLEKHGLDSTRLCLEVTENVFINRETDVVQGVLRRLASVGVMLSLDDFGTGYSSLGYLRSLPFAQLKIDQSFVCGADVDPRRQSVLAAVVALGRGLGMQVVAEGVETAREAAMIRAMGCDASQGFYFSRPHPALNTPVEAHRIRQMPFEQQTLSLVEMRRA